jgi:hypothetical protein
VIHPKAARPGSSDTCGAQFYRGGTESVHEPHHPGDGAEHYEQGPAPADVPRPLGRECRSFDL